MKKLFVLFSAILLLLAQSSAFGETEALKQADFVLQNEQISIGLGLPLYPQAKELDTLFQDDKELLEFPSCKFEGVQSNYRFGKLLAVCEPIGKKNAPVIDSLLLSEDSSYTTPRGIGIGADKEAVLSVYGKPVAIDGETLIFTAGEIGISPTILFTFEDNKVKVIEMQQNLR